MPLEPMLVCCSSPSTHRMTHIAVLAPVQARDLVGQPYCSMISILLCKAFKVYKVSTITPIMEIRLFFDQMFN